MFACLRRAGEHHAAVVPTPRMVGSATKSLTSQAGPEQFSSATNVLVEGLYRRITHVGSGKGFSSKEVRRSVPTNADNEPVLKCVCACKPVEHMYILGQCNTTNACNSTFCFLPVHKARPWLLQNKDLCANNRIIDHTQTTTNVVHSHHVSSANRRGGNTALQGRIAKMEEAGQKTILPTGRTTFRSMSSTTRTRSAVRSQRN